MRAACVAALTTVLAREDTDAEVAAFVIGALVAAGAVEAAPAIEAAFAADRVELSYNKAAAKARRANRRKR